MRILSVHNNYQIRGGEDESRESEERLLREMGHEVDVYEEHNDRVATIGAAKMALRTIWSDESYNIVREKLQKSPMDLMHVQNFFPLISPSIYYAAKSAGVPVVQTLRNYRLLCSNGLFFREGQVCEDCLGKFIPYPGVINGCYRENKAASAVVASMLVTHRSLQTWTKMVNKYICLTEFARQKFIAAGFPPEKIAVKPNFIPDPGMGDGSGGYALFVGRLSVEKGLDTLLSAWEKIGGKMPLKIVGDGPLSERVQQITQKLPQVEWLGRQPMPEVHRLMGSARVLIFPSEWYETFGRVAAEAFAKGTPVIAAKIGAIAELVEHGRTGLQFQPGNVEDLVEQVEWVLNHPAEFDRMRLVVRNEYETKYTPQKSYTKLMEIYGLVGKK
ncbi:glycosyltransferase family 4 protein [Calothrix sp. PCC 6303]|uniref:glycosyltransferase family 4 protein n=1 Tax=Calothrix sp. PCC 6303 TaxID=1170562 RepID=UPI0002A01494|nr:glycosyltransferase family 4 protein [Calothrix sp. PCC 6303]AFZ01170.1 glycosyl transferase group 1 [Calothrix sp. PCC 6303]